MIKWKYLPGLIVSVLQVIGAYMIAPFAYYWYKWNNRLNPDGTIKKR